MTLKGEGEGKQGRVKWFGYLIMLLTLTTFSLFTLILLATCTFTQQHHHQSSSSVTTVFAWKPRLGTPPLPNTSPLYKRLWGPVTELGSLYPYANPRQPYAAPVVKSTGFIFVRIQGGFHDIRTAVCDAVAISRLLNATLVIPEILSTTASKGISSDFKSFAYLYDEDQFIAALAKDINIVKTLPKNLNEARRKKALPLYRVPNSASPYFYLHQVLPMLRKHTAVQLLVSDGGCLQANLPPDLEEYQSLRCRVSFHALQFRQEIQELANKILNRLKSSGRPFIAYELGMTKDALAFYGCAELFQVGLILRANGYHSNTIIYVSGGEIFGGQRILIPLHAMFDNVVDRTSLSTNRELTQIYGQETQLVDTPVGCGREKALGLEKCRS